MRQLPEVVVEPRWHGVDALRAVVVLLGVALHGALPHLQVPLEALPWVVPTTRPSPLLNTFFWWFHAFQIPLFFLLAGFFAADTLHQRGPHGFAQHRLRRLVRPLLLSAAVLLPLLFAVFAAGWWANGTCTWNEIRRMKFAPALQAELYGPAHLWFLEYLVIYCALFWLWRTARPTRDATPRSALWPALLLSIPTALLLRVAPQVYTAHHNSFAPQPAVFFHQGIFFLAGVWLFSWRHALPRHPLAGASGLLVSLPLFAVVLTLLTRRADHGLNPSEAWQFAAALALFIWLTTIGVATSAAAWHRRPHSRIVYLSAASYWLYLVHLPILGAWQLLLAPLGAPALLEFTVAVFSTVGLGLWSYERWVRGRWLGAFLDGQSRTRSDAPHVRVAAH
ncbi:MAG: acyltransferase family protein [Deltaproteobacteria bacterium]|nr:acyltransferase family protein [Deltaproteobacteria bacterium]